MKPAVPDYDDADAVEVAVRIRTDVLHSENIIHHSFTAQYPVISGSLSEQYLQCKLFY